MKTNLINSAFGNRYALPAIAAIAVLVIVGGCATESHRTLQPQQVASAGTVYQGRKSTLVVGKFDNRSSTLLWEGNLMGQANSGGSGNLFADLIAAAITQAINQPTDAAHGVSRAANRQFAVKDHGLLYGPHHPKFGQD